MCNVALFSFLNGENRHSNCRDRKLLLSDFFTSSSDPVRINITFRSKVVRFVKLDPLINYPKSLCCLVCFLKANDSCFNPRQFFLNQHDWRAVNLKLKKFKNFKLRIESIRNFPPPPTQKTGRYPLFHQRYAQCYYDVMAQNYFT